MSVAEKVAELLRLDAQMGVLKARHETLRSSLLDAALRTLEEDGASPTWRVAGAGSVGLTVPAPRPPTVVDEARFLAFIEARYGEEAIETIRRVRPEAFDALVAECQFAESVGALVTPDGEQVPGMHVQTRVPYLSVRLSKEAKLGAAVDLALTDTAVEAS